MELGTVGDRGENALSFFGSIWELAEDLVRVPRSISEVSVRSWFLNFPFALSNTVDYVIFSSVASSTTFRSANSTVSAAF